MIFLAFTLQIGARGKKQLTTTPESSQAKSCIIAVYAGLGLKLASKRSGFDDALHESYAQISSSTGAIARGAREGLRDRGRPSS